MKKLRLFAALLTLSVIFMGCPYDSTVPIDNPSVKVSDKIIGNWEPRSSTDYFYSVTKGDDDFSYKIEKTTVSSGDKQTYKGYVSKIGTTEFLNVWEESEYSTEKKYYFYKIDMSEGDYLLKLIPVTENIDEKFTSSAELKKFFEKNMGNSYFFEKEEESYIRKK